MLPLMNLILVVPETLNLILLVFGCVKTYQSIEIGHPVFGLLFVNLICASVFTAFGVVSFIFLVDDKLIRAMNLFNSFAILYHCTSWWIISGLRYLFILHKDWVLEKFPDLKVLRSVSIGISVLIFSCTCGSGLLVGYVLGAANEVLFKDKRKMTILSIVIVAGFMIPIMCSCSTYLIIVAKKSRWAQNSVTPAPVPGGSSIDLESGESSNQIRSGSSRSIESVGPGDNPERHLTSARLELRPSTSESRIEDKRRDAEIASSLRSLKTNAVLSVVLVVAFLFLAFPMSDWRTFYTLLVFSEMKGLMPILTTVANFGTVQSILSEFWNNLKLKCSKRRDEEGPGDQDLATVR